MHMEIFVNDNFHPKKNFLIYTLDLQWQQQHETKYIFKVKPIFPVYIPAIYERSSKFAIKEVIMNFLHLLNQIHVAVKSKYFLYLFL